jgi:integrase
VAVSNKNWFNKNAKNENWIRQSDPEYAKKNETLAKELAEAKTAYSDLIDDQGVVTPYIIKAKVEEAPVALSFLEFVTEHNENLHANGQIRYWKQFRDLANKLELFRKKRRMSDILFVDLTVPFLDKFEIFLQQLPNQRDKDSGKVLNRNTVLNNMKRFRTLTRKAVKLGYLSADKDPFLNYEFHWLPTTKDKLESDEIDRIIKLDLEEGSMLWHARNCFLFSYYCAGIRVGDLIQLRWRNVEG